MISTLQGCSSDLLVTLGIAVQVCKGFSDVEAEFHCMKGTFKYIMVNSCSASSKFSNSMDCMKAFDGKNDVDWATKGQGKGSWIQANFGRVTHLTKFTYKQRQSNADWNKLIQVEFSDGSSHDFELKASSAVQVFAFSTPIKTSYIKITVVTEYSKRNNGAAEIQFFECPNADSNGVTIVLTRQQAAALLGYTQLSWDDVKQAQPASSKKQWAQLTATEKAAYTVLGYTQQTWSTISQSKTKWSSHVVTTVTTGTMTRAEAAKLLGYTQASWDDVKQAQPASSKKQWVQLTASQKAAYIVLGYTEKNWSTITKSKTKWSSHVVSTGTTIPMTRAKAAALLGYTQASWDNVKQTQPASSKKQWAQLSTTERSAAMALGYTEQTWSTISQTKTSWSYFVVSTGGSTVIVLTQQEAAVLLGYTQVTWDNASGKQAQPASSKKQWTQLTATERSAAIVLGYTELTWSKISLSKAKWSSFNAMTGTTIVMVQQQGAALLGFTQVSWDNVSDKRVQPASASKAWTGLTATERAAAMVLGYAEQTWSKISQRKAKWSSLTGITAIVLSRHQAAALLGYNQVSWDNESGKQTQPASASKQWSQLTATERSAATALGYPEQKWSKISQSKAKWSSFTSTTPSPSSTSNPGLIAAYIIIAIIGVLLLIGAILCIYYFVVMRRNQRNKEPKVIPDNGSAPKVVTVVPADETK